MSRKQSGRATPSLSRRVGDWFGKLNLLGDSGRASMFARRLGFEALEGRSMLSATPGASILGTTFNDLTLNGLTGDDTVLQGVTVKLYRDGGNGTFQGGAAGSDDTLVATTQSSAAGKYKFDPVDAGTYFVQEIAPAGGVGRGYQGCRHQQ